MSKAFVIAIAFIAISVYVDSVVSFIAIVSIFSIAHLVNVHFKDDILGIQRNKIVPSIIDASVGVLIIATYIYLLYLFIDKAFT